MVGVVGSNPIEPTNDIEVRDVIGMRVVLI